jgi:hypothetical protein
MPDIDVSDLTFDSDIAGEAFGVIRRQEVVGNNGVSVLTLTTMPAAGQSAIVGSITPTGDNSMVREEAFQTQAETVTVITAFRLRGASKDTNGNFFQPDIVVRSDGSQWIVKSLKSWASFGAGFVEAECVSFDFNAVVAAAAAELTLDLAIQANVELFPGI